MRASDAIATLEELGSTQWGLVTTGQAEAFGVSRVDLGRLHDNEIVHRVRRGVYALPSSGHGRLQALRAAWLATNPRTLAEERLHAATEDTVVSHVSAASVHGLGDLIPTVHEFSSTRRRTSTHDDVRFHRAKLAGDDRAIVNGLPVTSVVRTVADLAASGTDLDHLADVVRDALSQPDVDPQALSSQLDAVADRYGHEFGEALVAECLERAGLPVVAANLINRPSVYEQVARQLAPRLRSEVLDALLRDSISSELREAMQRVATTTFAGNSSYANLIGKSPALEAVREQLVATGEAQMRAVQPAIGAFQATTARAIAQALPASYVKHEVPHPQSADPAEQSDPSTGEEVPET